MRDFGLESVVAEPVGDTVDHDVEFAVGQETVGLDTFSTLDDGGDAAVGEKAGVGDVQPGVRKPDGIGRTILEIEDRGRFTVEGDAEPFDDGLPEIGAIADRPLEKRRRRSQNRDRPMSRPTFDAAIRSAVGTHVGSGPRDGSRAVAQLEKPSPLLVKRNRRVRSHPFDKRKPLRSLIIDSELFMLGRS